MDIDWDFIEIVLVLAFVGLLISTAGFVFDYAISGWESGTGTHAGYITAHEFDGILWKGYRVYVKTNIASSQEDVYCLLDNTLLDKIEAFQDNGTRVILKFKNYKFGTPWNCPSNEGSMIYGVDQGA